MTEAETRAAAWLEAWDSQGIHRTGTAGDLAGAGWLAAEAAALGAKVEIEEFALNRLDPVAAYLEIDGDRIPAVPLFDALPTAPEGIAGRLDLAGSDAEIGVVKLSPNSASTRPFQALRRGTQHRALVFICGGEEPGLALLNAEQFRTPFDPPAIHVGSEACDQVLAAAARGAPARLVADSRCNAAKASNVVVTLAGCGRARLPMVVMTPRSSWWQSTAERGGGLVCWLESLRALLAAPTPGDVIFTANSGHELNHLGLDDFLERRPGWDRPAGDGGASWVHYGANLGAAGGVLSLASNTDALRRLSLGELTAVGQPPDDMPPADQQPFGETRDIHRAGGAYLTLVGSNRWFRLPQDRWPAAIDLAAVARIAAASARIVLVLSRSRS